MSKKIDIISDSEIKILEILHNEGFIDRIIASSSIIEVKYIISEENVEIEYKNKLLNEKFSGYVLELFGENSLYLELNILLSNSNIFRISGWSSIRFNFLV